LVRVLADGEYTEGEHELVWNRDDTAGRSVASGVYFYRLSFGGVEKQRKMVILR
jgi:hypothetical protein